MTRGKSPKKAKLVLRSILLCSRRKKKNRRKANFFSPSLIQLDELRLCHMFFSLLTQVKEEAYQRIPTWWKDGRCNGSGSRRVEWK